MIPRAVKLDCRTPCDFAGVDIASGVDKYEVANGALSQAIIDSACADALALSEGSNVVVMRPIHH